MQLINVDIWQLLDIAENKKLICFGAGRALKNFMNDFKESNILRKIYCVIDNDEEKNNSVLDIDGNKLQVYSFRQFTTMDIEDYVIVITNTYVREIINQLDSFEQFKNIQCCYYGIVQYLTHEKEERERYYPENFRISETPKIPKRIHYCWFGGKEIPRQNRIWMETWKKYCPNYEIIEWNETNYDITKNQYMYDAYKAKKWGFVPDYARLDIIYTYGGIYLDTDVEIIRNLDELLYQDAFVGVDSSRRISLGLGFGAVVQFRIIKGLLDSYENIKFDEKNMLASPTLNEDVFRKYGFVKDANYQRIDGMTIYPEKVLSGKNTYTGLIEPTDKTFAIHHYDGSWNSEEKRTRVKEMQKLYQKLINNQNDGWR